MTIEFNPIKCNPPRWYNLETTSYTNRPPGFYFISDGEFVNGIKIAKCCGPFEKKEEAERAYYNYSTGGRQCIMQPAAWYQRYQRRSYYFRPLNKNVCENCRKQHKHLMTIADTWDELMIKWNRIQPYWLHRVLYWMFLVRRKGPLGIYRHVRDWNKFIKSVPLPSTTVINVANDFSAFPGGRYRTDGFYSGESFREDLLVPALKKGPVVVSLDGTMGFGSSFLEEAFGGLIKRDGFTLQALIENLTIEATDQSLVGEAWGYIYGFYGNH